jgi:type IV pilus assembly protein PilZ
MTMDNDSNNALRPSVVSLVIKERASLFASYMPFIEGGGVFVPSQKDYNMGDTVFVILQLMDSPRKFSISGKVIWISPPGIPQKTQGVGIQLPADEAGRELKGYIEKSLGNALGSSRKNHTI